MTAHPGSAPASARHRLVAPIAIAVLLAAGCSASGTKELTSSELSSAMPTAEDIGNGFARDEADEADDSSEFEVDGECKTLFNDDTKQAAKVEAKRKFKDGQNRQISVSASDTDGDLGSIEKMVKKCASVPFTDGEAKGTIQFTLYKGGDIGDAADVIDLELVFTRPISVTVQGRGVAVKQGAFGFFVLGVDGLDQQGNIASIDNSTIDQIARDLDQKIKDAQG